MSVYPALALDDWHPLAGLTERAPASGGRGRSASAPGRDYSRRLADSLA